MFLCQVAATLTFLLIRHQVIVADRDSVTFTEDNLTTLDYENATSTTEHFTPTFEDVSFIPADYDRHTLPKDPKVVIELGINGIVMDRNSQYCNLTFDLHFKWNDERLFEDNPWWKNNNSTQHMELVENIWNPMLVLNYQAILEGGIMHRFRLIANKNQTASINYNLREISYYRWNLNQTLGTKVNFQKYPADRHQYALLLASRGQFEDSSKEYLVHSYSHVDKDLVFGIDVQAMSLNDTKIWWLTSTNNLAVIIIIQRRIGNYIVQSYIPSGLFIILSWLSMFLPLDIATERVALCTATLLTLTTFTGAAKLAVPETSYMTGLDFWIVVSTLFIFLILVENICVLRIMGKKSGKILRIGIIERIVNATTKIHVAEILKSEKENVTSSNSNQNQDAVQEIGETHPIQVSKPEEWRTFARKLDIISAVVIAGLWIIFNVIYWIWLFANEGSFPDSTPLKVSHRSADDIDDGFVSYDDDM